MYGRYIIRKSVLWSNSDYTKTSIDFFPEVWICIPTNMEVIFLPHFNQHYQPMIPQGGC